MGQRKLAEFTSSRTNQGDKMTVSFYETSTGLRQSIYSGRDKSLEAEIEYRQGSYDKLVEAVLQAKDKASNTGNDKIISKDTRLNSENKIKLISDTAGSLTDKEIQMIKEDKGKRADLVRNIEGILDALDLKPHYYRENVEKTREEVLDVIYNNLGTDWFIVRDLKKIYDNRYETSEYYTAYLMLKNLKEGGDVERKPVGEDEYDDGRIRYKYRLTDKVIKQIEEHGSLQADSCGRWAKKRFLVEPPKSRNQ